MAVKAPTRGLAPPPSELEEMMAVEERSISHENLAAGEGVESGFVTLASTMTSPEAIKAGKNFVNHVGPPTRTLYDLRGESRQVQHTDVPMLVDRTLPGDQRLYLRCPVCQGTRDEETGAVRNGIHADDGPNACPARPLRMWMPCPICATHGREKRIYEDLPAQEAVAAHADEPGYVRPALPTVATREERLQARLEEHMVAFHAGEARQMYGLSKSRLATEDARR